MNHARIFPTLAERIAMTLEGLCCAVAARIAPGMAGWAMQAVMIQLVWTRVRRADGKIRALLARFQAGRLRVFPGRVRVRGAASPPGALSLPRSPTAKLPRRLGWLLPLVPCEAANRASQLRHLLGEPEMVALLRASAQARRILAPVCRMLGIEAELLTPVVVVEAVEAPQRVGSVAVDLGFAAVAGIPRGVVGGFIRRFPPGAG